MNVPQVCMAVTNMLHVKTHTVLTLAVVIAVILVTDTSVNKKIQMNVPPVNITAPPTLNAKTLDGALSANASRATLVTVSTVLLTITSRQHQWTLALLPTAPHTLLVSPDHMVVPPVNVNRATPELVLVTQVATIVTNATMVHTAVLVMPNA
jgi:hypothetical protein